MEEDHSLIDFAYFSKKLKIGGSNFESFISEFNEETFKVLYIGQCFQDALLKPFLEAVIKENERQGKKPLAIDVYSVSAQGSNDIFHRKTFQQAVLGKEDRVIKKEGYGGQIIDLNIVKFDPEHVDINFIPHDHKLEVKDLDTDDFSQAKIGEAFGKEGPVNFDVIFCCFELHFCVNWRSALINLLGCMNPGGIFIFSEASGNLSLIDGNFDPLFNKPDEEVYSLFKKFNKERTKTHYWTPEISFTNYVEVKNYLHSFFDDTIDVLKGKDGEKVPLKKFKFGAKMFKQHLEEGNFVYLSMGLNDHARMKLSREVVGHQSWESDLEYGVNFYLASGFNKEKFTAQNKTTWNYSNFSKDIQQLEEFEIEELARKSLDVFANHDVVFPNHTKYVGIVSWADATRSKLKPVQLLCYLRDADKGTDSFLKPFNDLLWLEGDFKLSFFDLVFNRDDLNYALTFQHYEDEDLVHLGIDENFADKKAYTVIKGKKTGKEWIAFKTITNRKGDIQSLNIGCSESFVKKGLFRLPQNPTNEIKKRDEDDCVIRKNLVKIKFEYPVHEVVNNAALNFKDIDGDARAVFEAFAAAINIVLPEVGRDNKGDNQAKTPVDILTSFNAQYFFRVFKLVYNFQLREKGTQLRIYPSILSENKLDETNKTVYHSLGGIMVYEKLTEFNDTEYGKRFRRLIDSRNKVLSQVANLIMYKAGLINYVALDYLKHARRAAIAAISARNVSHNLGSHVIPNITSTYKNVTHDINQLKDYNLILDYLQHRNDFINHLTSGKPGWAISAWFAKNLMARFLRQYMLLNSLAAFEGLEIYNYDDYIDYEERKWFIPGVLSDYYNNENEKNIMIYGYMNKDLETGHYVLTEEHDLADSEEKLQIASFDTEKIFKRHLGEVHEDNFYKILDGQQGRKFKLKGRLSEKSFDGNRLLCLENADFIEGKIIFKVRKRKYQYLGDGKKEMKDVSTVMSGKEEYYNVSQQGIDFQKILGDLVDSDKYKIVFGVIERIDREEGALFLFGPKEPTEPNPVKIILKDKGSLSTRDYQIELGQRVFVKFEKREHKPNQIQILDGEILEIVKIEHLILPFNLEKNVLIREDVLVAIPGGISGYQSFYTMLENILRNAAKHNWKYLPIEEKMGRNLEMKIEIDDQGNESVYICKIWTNVSNLKYRDGIPRYKNYRLLDEPGDPTIIQSSKESLSVELNKHIEKDVIKRDGLFNTEHLGVSEIKINAAYLQSRGEEIIEEYVIKGSGIILKDKQAENRIDGYLRASHIREYEKCQIVSRLGYRFKLQKPNDVVVISDHRAQKLFDRMGWTNLELKKNSIFDLSNEEGTYKTLDYEFCILFYEEGYELPYPEAKRPLASVIYDFLDRCIDLDGNLDLEPFANGADADILEDFGEISERIEGYPYRTFIVLGNDEAERFNDRSKLVRAIRSYEGAGKDSVLYKALVFIKSRIRFINENELAEWNATKSIKDEDYFGLFKLFLYDLWLCIYENNKLNKYNLNILLGDMKTKEQSYFPGSVPLNLRAELVDSPFFVRKPIEDEDDDGEIAYSKLSQFDKEKGVGYSRINFLKENGINIGDRNKLPEEIKNKEVQSLKYIRHNKEKKEAGLRFIENLSGDKNSFITFINPPGDKIGLNKLFFQLYENAYSSLIILDERIAKFFKNLKQYKYFTNFLNCNILVPHYFYYESVDETGKKINIKFIDSEIKLLQDEVDNPKEGNTEATCISESEFNSGSFKLKMYHQGRKPNITTIIIHQSFLEKIEKEESYYDDNQKRVIRGIIQQLKLDYPSLIITSGKNKSDLFSKGVKFLPFSVLEDLAMVENPDKFLLTQILFKTLN